MSLIYSSVKKGLPLLECPYFYYGIGQMRLRFSSMNLESKYKPLNSFQKDWVWIFRAKICDKMN